MENPIIITLKDRTLNPNRLIINISSQNTSTIPDILLKIDNTKQQSFSEVLTPRKYIFIIEELFEQFELLSTGDEHLFSGFKNYQNSKYHLMCFNYPKLQCQIELVFEQITISNEKRNNTIINSLQLEAVEEKQQQNKEDLGKEDSSQTKSDGVGSITPKDKIIDKQIQKQFKSPKPIGIKNYEKILLSQNYTQKNKQNKHIKYFQQQFKVWHNFFETKELLENKDNEVFTPTKQKPKSEYRKNSEKIYKSKIDSWQKIQVQSPNNIKWTHSCGTPENNENLSEFDKDKSQLINLRSYHSPLDVQLEKQLRIMKKTNSQHRLNMQNSQDAEKKDSEQEKVSKSASKIVKTSLFMEWLDQWATGSNPIQITLKNDDHIIKLWLGHLVNKYKVIKFLCE